MRNTEPISLTIRQAVPDVREAVEAILARQMGGFLAQYPLTDLSSDLLCYERLVRAGFSSNAIFHVGPEARFRAWEVLDPEGASREAYRNWLLAARKVPVHASYFARQ